MRILVKEHHWVQVLNTYAKAIVLGHGVHVNVLKRHQVPCSWQVGSIYTLPMPKWDSGGFKSPLPPWNRSDCDGRRCPLIHDLWLPQVLYDTHGPAPALPSQQQRLVDVSADPQTLDKEALGLSITVPRACKRR